MTIGASAGSRAEDVVDGRRVGVEVEHPAAPGDGGTEVAELRQSQASGDARAAFGAGGELHDGRAVRQVEDPGERRPVPLLEAGHRMRAEEEQHLGGLVRRSCGQPEGEPAGRACPGAPLNRSPEPRRRRREDLADGVVELADAREPGRERDVGHRQVGGLDEHPRGLGPLRPGERRAPTPSSPTSCRCSCRSE